jgi:peroxiredoxin
VDIAEGREKVRGFVQEQGLTFTILLDEDTMAARAYLVRAIPSSFFIDREGVIQASHTGPLDDALIDQYAERFLR